MKHLAAALKASLLVAAFALSTGGCSSNTNPSTRVDTTVGSAAVAEPGTPAAPISDLAERYIITNQSRVTFAVIPLGTHPFPREELINFETSAVSGELRNDGHVRFAIDMRTLVPDQDVSNLDIPRGLGATAHSSMATFVGRATERYVRTGEVGKVIEGDLTVGEQTVPVKLFMKVDLENGVATLQLEGRYLDEFQWDYGPKMKTAGGPILSLQLVATPA